MSIAVDRERAELAHEQRCQRAKAILQDMMAVLRYTADGQSVITIALQLGTSRPRVYWLQRVLGLREWRRSHDTGRGRIRGEEPRLSG